MPFRLPAADPLGFVAAETSKSGELAAATKYCATTRTALLVSSKKAVTKIAEISQAQNGPPTIIDTKHWRQRRATVDEPTEAHFGLTVFDIDKWCTDKLERSGATAILTPSFFVGGIDWPALQALLTATTNITSPEVITFIPTDADMLADRHRTQFLDQLSATPPRRFAFLFAAKTPPLAEPDRLRGLRELLHRFPGSWIIAVDVLSGTDALTHGAGWVGVGASSSLRLPQRPGDTSGPPSKGYLPGLFLRELLETRSPTIYGDWYANSPSPHCDTCDRALDVFDTDPADKQRIVEHNLHAIHDFTAEIRDQPPAERAAWLHQTRVDAFLAHGTLTSGGSVIKAEDTLRYLCEIDDPRRRRTRANGHWS